MKNVRPLSDYFLDSHSNLKLKRRKKQLNKIRKMKGRIYQDIKKEFIVQEVKELSKFIEDLNFFLEDNMISLTELQANYLMYSIEDLYRIRNRLSYLSNLS